MKLSFIASTVLALIIAVNFLVPAIATAQNSDMQIDDVRDKKFQLVPCSGVDAEGKATCDYSQLIRMINRIIQFLLYLSIPLVLGIIMYTAFKFITANGNPSKLADAKKMLIPVAIGLFWVLGGFLVVRTFLNAMLANQIGGETKETFLNRFLKLK